jgi:hypothetical protein
MWAFGFVVPPLFVCICMEFVGNHFAIAIFHIHSSGNTTCMHRSVVSWMALICIVLLVSAVSAVPYEASESTKDLLDAEALGKSLTIDTTPVVDSGGKTMVGVTLGSTDARYQAVNGKSFTVDPELADGGVDIAVGSTDASVARLLSGKTAHIPRTLDGLAITDPAVVDSAAFDRLVKSQVPGIVADIPARPASLASSMVYMSAGAPSYTSETTYRQAVADALFTPRSATHTLTFMAADSGAGVSTTADQSWWQWTKAKCKSGWVATTEFVKEHWLAILIVILVILIVSVIMVILFNLFGPAAAPATPHVVGATVAAVHAAIEENPMFWSALSRI